MRLYNLEGRYASALYVAATRKGKLESVEKELGKIKGFIKNSARIQNFLGDPTMNRGQKLSQIMGMLNGQNYSDITVNLFKAIAENGRLALSTKIIDSFESIMRAHRQEVTVRIVASRPLEKSTLEILTSTLKNAMFADCQRIPKISLIVDPKILGGLIIEVGDKTIDLSVATRLAGINKSLDETIYQ